jgi:hypothetical protein
LLASTDLDSINRMIENLVHLNVHRPGIENKIISGCFILVD